MREFFIQYWIQKWWCLNFFDTSRIGIWGKSHDFDIREIVKNIEPTHVDLELNKKFKSLKNDI